MFTSIFPTYPPALFSSAEILAFEYVSETVSSFVVDIIPANPPIFVFPPTFPSKIHFSSFPPSRLPTNPPALLFQFHPL